jgi:hypothetical protein
MTTFLKKLGDHRGAPRLYFSEPTALTEIGFKPGARYDITHVGRTPSLALQLNPKGKRAVCKKVVGGRTLCIIDINGKAQMEGFIGHTHARVTLTRAHIRIDPSMGEE